MPDYLKLRRQLGIGFSEYFDYGLYSANEEVRNAFLGNREQCKYLEVLNPRRYFSICRNKYFSHLFLESVLGGAMAELYCYYNPEYNVAIHERIACSKDDVIRILKDKNVTSCVIKTTEDSHGEGIAVIRRIEYLQDDCVLWRFDGNKVSLSKYLTKTPLIFESVITQTEQFNSFNASSVNCIRFMTTLWPNGDAKVIATFIKIGRNGKCVDNAGAGGNIDAKVELSTGRICDVIQFNGMHKVTPIENHPDSGNRLEGICIDNWEYIKNKVLTYQQALPFCKAAGWDIAITEEGPIIVEVNDFWDRTGQLFIGRGWRHEIKDCYEAWQKHYKKANET